MKSITRFSVPTAGWVLAFFLTACGASSPPAIGAPEHQFDTSQTQTILVVFENANYKPELKAAYFREFASRGTLLTESHAVIHPSQGNYIALVAGDTFGLRSDKNRTYDVKHLGDLLEERGKTWKVYAEDFPGDCYLGATYGKYARKHVPFLSFSNVQSVASRCAQIVNSSEFDQDVRSGSLPDYALYVPNLDNDGHDTNPTFASEWFRGKFGPLLDDSEFMRNRIVIATFDESDFLGGNHVYTALVGAGIKPGTIDARKYTHYDILRSLEDRWDLGTLGRKDAKAKGIPALRGY